MGAVVFLEQNLIGGNFQKIELNNKYAAERERSWEFSHLCNLHPQQPKVDPNPLSNINMVRLDNHLQVRNTEKSPGRLEANSLILGLPTVCWL